MENFVKIAEGLDTAPALAALAALDPCFWVNVLSDTARMVPLLGPDGRRRHGEALAEIWALIDAVHAQARRDFGDRGAIVYARAGRLPPGDRVLPHADGHDGVVRRRYQIVLQSAPEARIMLGGEIRSLAAGEAWQIDSSKLHSVVNDSETIRLVLVFDTEAQEPIGVSPA